MTIILRSIGALGALLFSLLFSATFLSPEVIEGSAKSFVKYQIEKEIRHKQQAVIGTTVADRVLDFTGKLGVEKRKIQEDINNKLPEQIARVIASMCGYDCEKKKALSQSITSGYIQRIQSIQVAENTLNDIIKGKYIEIVDNLKLDLRVFLGSNFAMFLILLAVSFTKPKAVAHLFLPGILLLLATILSSSLYLFAQDWFYTILYNDFMGFGYLAYVAIIFGILLDIVINKAKITTRAINSIADAIGAAFSLIPC